MTFLRLFAGYCLQTIPFAFLCIYPFTDHLRMAKKKAAAFTVCGILFLGLLFTVTCLWMQTFVPAGQRLFHDANLIFMLCLIPCFVWYFCIVREIWQKKVFVFVFAMTGALAMTSVCNAVQTRLLLDVQTDGLPYYGSTLILLSAATSVILPLFFLLLKYRYNPVSDALEPKESGLLSLLSAFLFVVLASGLIASNYANLYNPMSLFLYAALLLAVFVLYNVFFQLFRQSHEKISAQRKLAQIRFQLDLQGEQYKRINDNIEKSRKMRHDFRHHMVALQGFFNNGDVERAKRYIGEYVRVLDDNTDRILSQNPIVDSVAGYYEACAKEEGIFFTAHIDVPRKLAVSNADLAVLLGNLLENAIEAAGRVESSRRFISVHMICSGQMFAVTVDNSFNGNLLAEGRCYRSTKNQHTGIGLQSIRSIAEKYGGGVEFEHERNIFHASVMLNMG